MCRSKSKNGCRGFKSNRVTEMIYDGVNGYLSGKLNQGAGVVLAMTKGPKKGRNWFATTVNPTYSITISAGAAGTVKLQGTSDVSIRSDADGRRVETDLLPTENASWTDIQTATSTSVTGSFSAEYEFLRLVIGTAGSGYVMNAWVRWS